MPNTPSAELLTSADVERRTSSFNARRALLKSNPSLFISITRLSVRQIPTFVTERMLKRLASHAVKTFESEVKQNLRQPLTADELARVVAPEESGMVVGGDGDDVVETVDNKNKKSSKFKGRDTGVKQAKIVRQAERVDSLTGKGRSKGYGFIEMHKHADALRVLRWANNNPDIGSLFNAWWKDELENLLKLEKAKPESEKDDARVKRLKEEMDRWSTGDGKKKTMKGSLIVEFSIENIQVTKRRSASQKDQAAAIVSKKLCCVAFSTTSLTV
jgi:nucleolar protein 4